MGPYCANTIYREKGTSLAPWFLMVYRAYTSSFDKKGLGAVPYISKVWKGEETELILPDLGPGIPKWHICPQLSGITWVAQVTSDLLNIDERVLVLIAVD